VALRSKELGIRIALGARRRSLIGMILRHVLTPVVIGMAVGVLAAVPAAVALAGEPFHLELSDPLVFATALLTFMVTGAGAALWPALHALRGNPVDALRHS